MTDYLSEEDVLSLIIRAVWAVAITLIVAVTSYWMLADPLLELARHAGRALGGRQRPDGRALADAEDAIQRAIAAHDAQ